MFPVLSIEALLLNLTAESYAKLMFLVFSNVISDTRELLSRPPIFIDLFCNVLNFIIPLSISK